MERLKRFEITKLHTDTLQLGHDDASHVNHASNAEHAHPRAAARVSGRSTGSHPAGEKRQSSSDNVEHADALSRRRSVGTVSSRLPVHASGSTSRWTRISPGRTWRLEGVVASGWSRLQQGGAEVLGNRTVTAIQGASERLRWVCEGVARYPNLSVALARTQDRPALYVITGPENALWFCCMH